MVRGRALTGFASCGVLHSQEGHALQYSRDQRPCGRRASARLALCLRVRQARLPPSPLPRRSADPPVPQHDLFVQIHERGLVFACHRAVPRRQHLLVEPVRPLTRSLAVGTASSPARQRGDGAARAASLHRLPGCSRLSCDLGSRGPIGAEPTLKPTRLDVDTSVFGGRFDPEYEQASQRLFREVRLGKHVVLVSETTATELVGAPAPHQCRPPGGR